MASAFKLAAARYGKTNVRVLRVIRDAGEGKQEVAEYNVTLLVDDLKRSEMLRGTRERLLSENVKKQYVRRIE